MRDAYRKLAREYHPDISADPEAHERMAAINAAFEVLSDPVRRMEYDASIGHAGLDEPNLRRGPSTATSIYATVVTRLTAHKTPVYSLTFDRAGQLISSSFDNELIWWQPKWWSPGRQIKLEGGIVGSIAVSPEGLVTAIGASEKLLTCWRVGTKIQSVWREQPNEWIVCVEPSPDGQSAALGTVGSHWRVVSSQNGATRFSGEGHTDSITALAWSSDSTLLATGSTDATVRLWCGATGRQLAVLQRVRSAVTSMAFSPDGKWLAVAAVDLSIRVFKLEDQSLHQTFHGHIKPIESLAFHPKGWLLGSASRDGQIGLWDIRRGIDHGRIEASHVPLSSIAFSPDGLTIATGGLDKVLRIWQLQSR